MCFGLRMRDLGEDPLLPVRGLDPSERALLRLDPERGAVPVRPGRGEGDPCGVAAGVLACCSHGWRAGRPSAPSGIVGGNPGGAWADESISAFSEESEGADHTNESSSVSW